MNQLDFLTSDHCAGVDEVGRGPLAGPVIAAAVILDPARPIAGLTDSKKLSARQREHLSALIWENAVAVSVAEATVAEIDELNILQASLLAMRRAVLTLAVTPGRVQVDGNRCPVVPYPCEAIVRGDSLIPAISAASIVAKVARDRLMVELAERYPGYGFEQHSGYPTQQHLLALDRLGVSNVHRKTFGPVKSLLKIR